MVAKNFHYGERQKCSRMFLNQEERRQRGFLVCKLHGWLVDLSYTLHTHTLSLKLQSLGWLATSSFVSSFLMYV